MPMVEVSKATDGMALAERRYAQGAFYQEVMEILDAAERAPDAGEYAAAVRGLRVTMTHVYQCSDDEIAAALDAYLAMPPEVPNVRAWTVIAACANRAQLVTRYLPALIHELERQPDAAGDALPCAREWCARFGIPI